MGLSGQEAHLPPPCQHIGMRDMLVNGIYMYITMLKRIKKGSYSQAYNREGHQSEVQ